MIQKIKEKFPGIGIGIGEIDEEQLKEELEEENYQLYESDELMEEKSFRRDSKELSEFCS